MKQKIKVSKKYGAWWCTIPGDVPDCSRHEHFSDALAKVQWALRTAIAGVGVPAGATERKT